MFEIKVISLARSLSGSVSKVVRTIGDNPLKTAAGLLGVLAVPLCIWLTISGPGASAQYEAYKWTYDKTSEGIVLFTSDAPHHSYDAVQVSVTLDARPETLISILREIPAYPTWYARCTQTRVLKRPPAELPVQLSPDGRKFLPNGSQESYTLFFLEDVPVVADRWAAIRSKIRFGNDGSLVVEFRSLDNFRYQPPSGTVRMHVFGYWILRPLSPTRIRVTLMIDVDPMLSVPDFLVDPFMHDVAIDTVAGLRKIARSRR
jgi:ribosome-associated toxin RatA of RatAB toxin-antitoxin module